MFRKVPKIKDFYEFLFCINTIVSTWIAPVCKEEQYKTDLVRNKLLRYSKDKTLGILSLNAAMFLKML